MNIDININKFAIAMHSVGAPHIKRPVPAEQHGAGGRGVLRSYEQRDRGSG